MSFLPLWHSLTPWISSRVRLTVKEWNELPASVAESDSLDIFKSQINCKRVEWASCFRGRVWLLGYLQEPDLHWKSEMSFLLLWQSLTSWISSRVRLTVKEWNKLPAFVAASDSWISSRVRFTLKEWNELPASVAESDSLDIFKSQINCKCKRVKWASCFCGRVWLLGYLQESD